MVDAMFLKRGKSDTVAPIDRLVCIARGFVRLRPRWPRLNAVCVCVIFGVRRVLILIGERGPPMFFRAKSLVATCSIAVIFVR